MLVNFVLKIRVGVFLVLRCSRVLRNVFARAGRELCVNVQAARQVVQIVHPRSQLVVRTDVKALVTEVGVKPFYAFDNLRIVSSCWIHVHAVAAF